MAETYTNTYSITKRTLETNKIKMYGTITGIKLTNKDRKDQSQLVERKPHHRTRICVST